MSKHTAPTNLQTLAAELIFHAIFGESTPNRGGKYRADTNEAQTEAAA